MTRIWMTIVCALLGAVAHAGSPNVVLILSDDQAWTDYGFMGHPHVDTPHLDQLAAESLTYTRGYVTSPLCRPSLASILTGLSTHRHGTTGNDPATGDTSIRNMASRTYARHDRLHRTLYKRLRSLPNFVRLLREAGYETMQTGKWWESDPKTFGFSHAMTHGDHARGARHGDEGLAISRAGIDPIRRFLDDCRASEGREAKPFFVWHAPFLPHAPHTPPPKLLAKYQELAGTEPLARYWAMCEWFDETCGELLKELDDRGLKKNTVVIYITDNGSIQNLDAANRFAPRSKTTSYEGGIRTPVMIRWPGVVLPFRDTGTLVSAIDIAPTILSATGIAVPDTMSGFDLCDQDALTRRNAVFGSDHPHDIADVERPNIGVEARYVIRGPWKLIVHSEPEAKNELFHLEADPYERANLSAKRPEVVTRLKHRELEHWWTREARS